jgi:hypothetical protein
VKDEGASLRQVLARSSSMPMRTPQLAAELARAPSSFRLPSPVLPCPFHPCTILGPSRRTARNLSGVRA